MYSDKLLTLFKKERIEVGDTIELISRELTVKGELMPKTEVSAEDVIILKLDNGYNIGIAYSQRPAQSKNYQRAEKHQHSQRQM